MENDRRNNGITKKRNVLSTTTDATGFAIISLNENEYGRVLYINSISANTGYVQTWAYSDNNQNKVNVKFMTWDGNIISNGSVGCEIIYY